MAVTLHQMVRARGLYISYFGIHFQIIHSINMPILAYRILIPSELTNAMKEYCDSIGLTELARSFIMSEDSNIKPG